MSRIIASLAFAALFLSLTSLAHASSASFQIRGDGIKLGEPTEETAEQPLQYSATIEQGKPFTLTAQGVVLARGEKKPEPFEPDAAAWLFDDEVLQLVPHDKSKVDKTMTVVALQASKPGKTRIRFTGNVLGYDRKFDIQLEVVAPKP
jgi:hypothetical protein